MTSIPSREKLVALAGALTLIYTAWGFGGVIAWSLHVMIAGGLITLALALLPVGGGDRASGGIRKLIKTPAFYFAAAFLLYLAIGALNPSWEIVSNDEGWWIERITPPLAEWLPSSVESPYQPMNPWRIFNMHLAAFSLAIGLKVGLNSRRSILFVLWSFALSALLMATVAIVQEYTDADAVLWLLPSENKHFWGSFFYRNQGVAYLNFGIIITGVLYFYHARNCREQGRSGGPHFLATCCIGLIAFSVVLALSRGGILFGGFLVAAFLILLPVDFLVNALRYNRPGAISVMLILLSFFLVAVYGASRTVKWDTLQERFGNLEDAIEEADSGIRALSTKQTWEMAQQQPWTGWGAGSFRYVFPLYQQEVPELFYHWYHKKEQRWVGRRFFRYAHNDVLQFFAEYGLVGFSLLLATILCFVFSLLRGIIYYPFLVIFMFAGFICMTGHAFVDFIFHSPAVWVVFVAGFALVGRLMSLQRHAH